MESFVALKYNDYNNSDMPTINVYMDRVVGEKLDFNNLTKEEFQELINNVDCPSMTFQELNPETINLGMQAIYDKTKKIIANKFYVGKDFNIEATYGLLKKENLEVRDELDDKTIVMLYLDDLSFPAYKNIAGKVEIINSALLLVCKIGE